MKPFSENKVWNWAMVITVTTVIKVIVGIKDIPVIKAIQNIADLTVIKASMDIVRSHQVMCS
jgi:hypothetical protein